jgi:hypothetical protein
MPRVGFETTIPAFERAKQFMPETAWPLWSAHHRRMTNLWTVKDLVCC